MSTVVYDVCKVLALSASVYFGSIYGSRYAYRAWRDAREEKGTLKFFINHRLRKKHLWYEIEYDSIIKRRDRGLQCSVCGTFSTIGQNPPSPDWVEDDQQKKLREKRAAFYASSRPKTPDEFKRWMTMEL